MKKWICLCICAMAGWSCEDFRPLQNQPHTVEAEITGITETSAACSISIEPSGATQKVGIVYGTDPSLQTNTSELNAEIAPGNSASFTLSGLYGGTDYYIEAYATDQSGYRIYGHIQSFRTGWITLTEFGNGIVASKNFGGGDGTRNSPFLIADARHLKKMVDDSRDNNYSGIYFKLTTDIQVTADEWVPIGDYYSISRFQGAFDGGGHTISGTLKSENYSSFGFFRYLNGATVSNLTISAAVSNDHISNDHASTDWNVYTGALAGYVEENSVVRDCNVSGPVKGGRATREMEASRTGGVAGEIRGSDETPVTVSNCTVSESVTGGEATGGSYTGGIAGTVNNNVEIANCTVSQLVTGGTGVFYSFTGGVAGRIGDFSTIIRDCNVSGKVQGGRATRDEVINGYRQGGDSYTGGVAGAI
ncbi:MAG: hypothetical protein LBF85_09790, partial [Tannerella sp.]|nr:hypothetical protein [Tannerella sp.]